MTPIELSIIFTPILIENITDNSSQNLIFFLIKDYPKVFNVSKESIDMLLQDSLGEKESLLSNENSSSKKKIFKHGVQLKKVFLF